MDYPEIAANVPLPTFEQTIRFADHVASNRSWYKHLPLFSPGDSFVFFLNPNAGMGVQQKDGVYKVYSIERADYFQHHSRLSCKFRSLGLLGCRESSERDLASQTEST